MGVTSGVTTVSTFELPPMPLTNTAIRNAKPEAKHKKLFDGGGLYLQVTPTGGKWWRLKYRFKGKEKLLSLGVYPDVSLKAARERRQQMRELLANDIDPSLHRKLHAAHQANHHANTFEVVAREWLSKYSANWASSYATKVMRRLEKDIFPWIGNTPMVELTPPTLLATLQRIENRGTLETAHRVLRSCGQIFRYAVSTGRVERDITTDLRGALAPAKTNHLAAIIEPKQAGELLRAIDDYQGTFVVKCALRIAPMVFVRPTELRTAKWQDINFEKAEWRYHVNKTKTDHIVPLATQAIAILKELYPLTCNSPYVFPSARSIGRPMSDNAILAALRRMGIEKDVMTGHGFRAMARTILDEVLGVRPDYIEHQLAHAVRDPNGRAYNRTAHLPERRKMMQQWADYLENLKKQI